MKFAAVPIREAEGAILAHAVRLPEHTFKKGEIVGPEVIAVLAGAGVASITVAQLEPTDVGENDAARLVAEAVGGDAVFIDKAFTGRANVFARSPGVLRIDAATIDRINAVDESVTVATLPAYRTVVAGEMVATVKIIPFAVPRSVIEQVLALLAEAAIDVAAFRPLRVAVISTVLPGLKSQVITKTLSHLADRLAPAGASIIADERVPHTVEPLVACLRDVSARADLVVVFGASAITDRRDIIPAAIEEAQGTISHFGMPVDPGNLLLLGAIGDVPVIGAPGCARSPKENGFDWVLHRLLAGMEVTAADLRSLGVGGLLMEIVSRPQPRLGAEEPARKPRSRAGAAKPAAAGETTA